jgi:hypothetical protein
VLILVLWLAAEPGYVSKVYVYLDDSFAQQHGRLLLLASAREQIKENENEKENGSGREENASNHIIEETLKEKKIIPAL